MKDRIREFNATFICDKFGLRISRNLKLTFKMVKYAFLVGRGWQLLPTFLSTKEAKTKTNVAVDMRYSMSSKVRISQNAIAIKQLCYDHNVYLYEEQLQININVFFFL